MADDWTATAGQPVDLTSCDREPIHIPELTQPHGAVVALDATTLRGVRASENVGLLTGLEWSEWVGVPFVDCVDAPVAEAFQREEWRSSRPTRFYSGPVRGDYRLNLIGHEFDGRVIIEFERLETTDASLAGLMDDAVGLTHGLSSTSSELECAEQLVDGLQSLLGYDRVMLYRFSEDWHGQVLAEARLPELEPFLGLHYPASDIPSQARRLFTLNPVRLISDVDGNAVPLQPPAGPGESRLDLTHASSLRGVSPIHIEYLNNMGVKASMSISLLVKGELWGLIACHHYSGPMPTGPTRRGLAELVARVAQLRFAELLESERNERRSAGYGRLGAISRVMAQHDDFLAGLTACTEPMWHLVDSRGFLAAVDSEVVAEAGIPMAADAREAVLAWLETHEDVSVESSRLWSEVPALDGSSKVAGVLAIRPSYQERTWLVWFRDEQREHITWAGRPDKIVNYGPNGPRLTPRKSFEAFVEEVRGQSLPFSGVDRELVEALRTAFSDVLFRERRRLLDLTALLEIRNQELDQFASLASHDLREPLRAIRNYASFLAEDLVEGEPLELVTSHVRAIERLVDRTYVMIDGLIHFARFGEKAPELETFSMQDAVDVVMLGLGATIADRRAQVSVPADLPELRYWRTGFEEVLQNLVANAIRHSPDRPEVTIGVLEREAAIERFGVDPNTLVVFVKDNGSGIDPVHLPRIFHFFFRAKRRETSDATGAGIGLTIVRKIVERLGGSVWVDSTLGEGSTFYFSLVGQPPGPDELSGRGMEPAVSDRQTTNDPMDGGRST